MNAAIEAMRDAEGLLGRVTEKMRGRPDLRDEQVRRKLLALRDALRELGGGGSGASKRAQRVLAVEVLGVEVSAARYVERWVPRDVPMRGVGDALYAVEAVARGVLWALRQGSAENEAARLVATTERLLAVTCRA